MDPTYDMKLAQLLAADLTAAELGFVAEAVDLVHFDRKPNGLEVKTIPRGFEQEEVAAGLWERTYTVAVVMFRLVAATTDLSYDPEKLAELRRTHEKIATRIGETRIDGLSPESVTANPSFDPQRLVEERKFVALIEATYTKELDQ